MISIAISACNDYISRIKKCIFGMHEYCSLIWINVYYITFVVCLENRRTVSIAFHAVSSITIRFCTWFNYDSNITFLKY